MQQQKIIFYILMASTLIFPSLTLSQDANSPDFKVELNVNGCQFSGGTDGYGNVEVPQKTGGKKIQVELLYSDDLIFEPTTFTGTGVEQMKETAGGNANVLNIFNANTGPADVYYKINLKNKQTGEKLSCDPQIINK